MRKKQLYRLHRLLSFLIGIPVFLWAVSGLLHPLMTSVRPLITTQSPPIDTLPAVLPDSGLHAAFSRLGIHRISSCRIVKIEGQWYAQVSGEPDLTPLYIRMADGQLLPDGDQLYARMLASHFLSGNAVSPVIKSVHRLTQFTPDYRYVNRILPVYKVRFNRADSICIYVNTAQSDFSFAEDNHRAAFNRFFAFFHTWSWLDQYPGSKAAIISCILLLTLFTASLGMYFAFTTRSKTKKGNRLLKARKLHRTTAVIAVIFTLAWAFSGMVHAIASSLPDTRGSIIAPGGFETARLPSMADPHLSRLLSGISRPLIGMDYIAIGGRPYLRLRQSGMGQEKHQDLMKDMGVMADHYVYIDLLRDSVLQDGDRYTALLLARQYLATRNVPWKTSRPRVSYLTSFDASYNFSDKILPVWKISPDGAVNHTVFIDTRSGKLAKEGSLFAQIDALCFAFFHKHEFMAWAGKSAKDMSTIIGVLLVLTMLIFGYRLVFIRWRMNRRQQKKHPHNRT